MSGIYIEGMEMPACGYVCLTVFSNGDVLMTKERRGALVITGIRDKVGTAVHVPPHGRLIDADALMETFRERKRPTLSDGADGSKERVRYLDFISTLRAIKDAPTIIPADKGR